MCLITISPDLVSYCTGDCIFMIEYHAQDTFHCFPLRSLIEFLLQVPSYVTWKIF